MAVLPQMDGRTYARLAAAVCVLVVVLRVILALVTPAPELVLDAAGYDASGRRLVTEGYYAHVQPGMEVADPGPDANTLPGYAVFLAALYGIAGAGAPPHPLVSVAQALLSGVTLWGIFLLGRRVISPRGGFVAVLLGAAYVPFWYSYRYVLTEDLFMALSVVAMVALIWAVDDEGRSAWVRYVAFGIAASAALYVRAAAAPWLLLAFVVVLVAHRRAWRRMLVAGLVTALTVGACFAPWWYRNEQIYGEFVALSARGPMGGFIATFEDWGDLTEASTYWEDRYLSPREQLAEDAKLARLTRERNREQFAADPIVPVWRRVRATIISVVTYHPNPFGGYGGFGALTLALHLGILALAVRGLWLYRRSWEAWLLISYPVAQVLTYMLVLIFSRYLFPAMPFMIVLAAAGITGRPRDDEPVGARTVAA